MDRSHGTRHGRAVGVVLAVSAGLVSLVGCGSGADCGELYSRAILAVDGVASVEADCSTQFGGGWQRIDVALVTHDADEARTVVDGVLRALAADADLEDVWATPRQYSLGDGSVLDEPRQGLGFNGVPTIGDVREQYDIAP